MATVSWTAVLSIVFAPLIVARLIVDRSKNAWCLAILWASGVWLQISETVLGRSHHDEYGYNSLFFVLQELRDPGRAAGAVRRALARRGRNGLPRRHHSAAAHHQRGRARCPDRLRVGGGPRHHRASPSPGSPTRTGRSRASPRCSAWRIFVEEMLDQHVRGPAALRRRARPCCSTLPWSPSCGRGGGKATTRAVTAVRWLPAAGFAVLLAGRGHAQLPGDQRPYHQPGVDQRGRHGAQRLRHAARHGVYVCARVVVCNNPVQQGRVGCPARTGYAINVT